MITAWWEMAREVLSALGWIAFMAGALVLAGLLAVALLWK